MRIKGHIDVTNVETGEIIASCDNNFTDIGRQHVCNWLLHDNYSEDVLSGSSVGEAGGRSLSDSKLIPYNEIQWKRVGTHSYVENPQNAMYPMNKSYDNYMRLYGYNQFWEDYPYSYDDSLGTIFYEFSSPKNLQSIMMFAMQTSGWDQQWLFEISTSPDTFDENVENPNWTRQKIDQVESDWDSTWATRNRCINYRLNSYDEFNKAVENVRTVRIRSCYLDWTRSWANIYGIWFFESNHYPNTPSVIALGTDDTPASTDDTVLGSESLRKFIFRHNDAGEQKVSYSIRLLKHQGNDTNFNEVGLFFHPKDGDHIGGSHGPDICTSLFARGVFDNTWSKTEEQIIDVNYTLTLSN